MRNTDGETNRRTREKKTVGQTDRKTGGKEGNYITWQVHDGWCMISSCITVSCNYVRTTVGYIDT